MNTITLAAATLAASVGTIAAAQPAPSSHEQHQTTRQHQAKAGEERCEQMMREMHKMMSEMMRMHQGMAEHSSHDSDKDKPQEQPKH